MSVTQQQLDTKGQYQVLQHPVRSTYTAIDLFAGAGGTALGLENAGLNHIYLNECDRFAVQTLQQNRPNWTVDSRDIGEVDFKNFHHRVDVLEGGFPCQAFSYAGKKKGFDDARGNLFYQFVRAVQEIQPKIVIGENVRGLVNHRQGSTLRTMINALQQAGYRCHYQVLQAQYFDVPQKRERLIIIGVRNDLALPIMFPKAKNYTISVQQAIGDYPQAAGQTYSASKKRIMALVPAGGYWRHLPAPYQREYMQDSYFAQGGKTGIARRLAWHEPSLTLTCHPSQKQTERCHPAETRPLNTREYARLQTFPDDWQFCGSMAQIYRQIGNAVPVNLGYHLGRAVIAMLDNQPQADLEVMPATQSAAASSLI